MQDTIGTLRRAINAKRWDEARHQFRRARVLVAALPATQIKAEQEQLSLLRQKFAARGTPVAQLAARAKQKAAARKRGTKPTAKPANSKAAANSKTAKPQAAKKPEPAPVRDLGDRFINRIALGYAAADETRG